jgi:hypothetical protein
MAKAAKSNADESWETSDQLVQEYLTYTHGVDGGANIADLLNYWYQSGKILAFAPVDHTNTAAVDAAMKAFTGLYCGVQLTPDADQLCENNKPWTVSDGQQPDPSMGHCIVKVGATGTFDDWVTWGLRQKSTTEWTAECLEEAWVIITAEDAHRVDLGALQTDINALGGVSDAA